MIWYIKARQNIDSLFVADMQKYNSCLPILWFQLASSDKTLKVSPGEPEMANEEGDKVVAPKKDVEHCEIQASHLSASKDFTDTVIISQY